MSRPEYIIGLYTLLVCIVVLCCSLSNTTSAQLPLSLSDSNSRITNGHIFSIVDSFKRNFDSMSAKRIMTQKTSSFKGSLTAPSAAVSKFMIDSASKAKFSLMQFGKKEGIRGKEILSFDGGMTSYQFSYRSTIDTPFIDRNVQQHTLTGDIRLTLGDVLPIRALYYLRNTNSAVFRDIYDVRVEFDAQAFRNNVQTGLHKKIAASINELKDPNTEKLYDEMLKGFNSIQQYFNSAALMQQLIDANKILRIPAFSYDLSLPDSLAKQKSDSLRNTARLFLDEYNQKKAYVDSLSGKIDSLRNKIQEANARINQLKDIGSNQFRNWSSYKDWRRMVSQQTGADLQIPKKYQWLLGIRQMGLGRNQLNYSELTAKNLSLTGLNFEYNSWYYLAVSAGLVDYRFRDFAVHPMRRSKQYMYLVRLGVGQLNKNYLIVSAFKGQKQLYTSSNSAGGLAPLAVSGLSAESKWQVSRNAYLQAEIAQSFSADFRDNPPTSPKGWDLSDKTNKAYALKWYSYFSKTGSRVEAIFKYTGANYQSFSSFQTNAAVKAWSIRAEQFFFKRQLRLSGALRSNDFANPYLVQNYSSNSVFKSIYGTFKRRKWPSITIGYLPSSQITKLENQLYENRFYTFNTSLNHFYKLGTIRSSSTLIFNRFYNNSTDTGFIYFNAMNVFAGQNFFFKHFTANLNVSSTSNSAYKLVVLDENMQFNLFSWGGAGCGIKVNILNQYTNKLGFYGNLQIKINRQDIVYVSYDQGYLPGRKNELVHNDFVNVSFLKYFK